MEKSVRPIQNDVGRESQQVQNRRLRQAEAQQQAQQTQQAQQPRPAPAQARDEVVLSRQAQDLSKLQKAVDSAPDTRALAVAQLRQQVLNGTYKVSDDVLADRIMKAFGIG
jgi:flagellar biosynthesis anti-sigma factor FlgM